MNRVFGDTLYWIAISNPHDPWHKEARAARFALGECVIVTTDAVLTEFLTAFSAQGSFARTRAVATVEQLLTHPDMRVLPQSRSHFLAGVKLYRSRVDKSYSLTDCISMNIMREAGLTEILTNDHHFSQEGFAVLIHRE